VKKIVVINITGGPMVGESGLGFTEGGLVHALFALANLASEYDIKIICPNLPGDKQKRVINHRGVTIVCLNSSRWIRWMRTGSLSFIREAYEYVREEEPDILIGNGVLGSFLLRFVPQSALRLGIIHHLYHVSSVNGSSKHVVRGIGALERLALRLTKLDRIGVVNPETRNTLVERGFCPESIVVVGNGVNIDDYSFCENKDSHSLIYIGRLTELKRVSSLVEIVSMIKKEIPDIILHIVGDGPKCEEVKRRIKALGVSDNVAMHGYVSEEDKIRLLGSSAVYVSNSSFEGFGIPLVEAMATGTVPVVSDLDAHRFIFQGEDVGYLVNRLEDMAARAVDLLTNRTRRLQLARNGRKLVEGKWTWAKVGDKYRELIQSL
jgi:glycosyltransferase involved in cell wall biosynthesis